MAGTTIPPHLPRLDERSVRAYLEDLRNTINPSTWASFVADAGSATADAAEDTFNILGSQGVSTSITSDVLTISVDTATDSTLGLTEYATSGETNTGLAENLSVTPLAISNWEGSERVITLGTISTGTWEGSTIAVDQGGTGQTSYTDGQILIGNSTGNTLDKATITAGEGIDVTNGGGSITVAGEDASDTNKGIATFDITDFTVSSGDVTLNAERIQDIAGAMATSNTETGISVTYQDADGTIDYVVSDTTVAGDSGSTGITPGDTLTIAGGTNTTTAMSGDTLTVNVDDSFILNTGDVGTGVYDFGGATSFEIPNGATPTVDAAGEIAIDTTITDYTGLVKYHDGTEELTVVAMPTANLSTTDNHVVIYDAAANEFTMEAQTGGVSGGKVLQVVQGTKTDTASTTSTTFVDTGVSVAITPASTSNDILIMAFISCGGTTAFSYIYPRFQLVRGSTNIIEADTASNRTLTTTTAEIQNANGMTNASISYLDSPSTTSATTYKLQYSTSTSGGTVYVNRTATDTDSSAFVRGTSVIIAMEIDGS